MTKEFEHFKEILSIKQTDLEIQTRAQQQEGADKKRAEQQLKDQEKIESKKRSVENRKIFEDASVIKLFEEIRDSGLVKCNNEPIYEKQRIYKNKLFGGREWVDTKKIKIADYEPALIKWGDECESISLIFNVKTIEGEYQTDYRYWDDHITLHILSDKKIGAINFINGEGHYKPAGGIGKSGYAGKMTYDQIKVETEITNIPEYVANEISKTLNF